MEDEKEEQQISVHITTQTGDVYTITMTTGTGANGLYNELSDVLPLVYLNYKQEWFKFKRQLSDNDLQDGHQPYDFYRMRDGEQVSLTIERPSYEHLVGRRTFYSGGLMGDLCPELKSLDKEFVTHYGYYFQVDDNHSYNNNNNNNNLKPPIIVLFQKTSLYPTRRFPPNFTLGLRPEEYNKSYVPVNKFFAYACDRPTITPNVVYCFNPLKHSYDQSLEWKDTVQDALVNVKFYDETFDTRTVLPRVQKRQKIVPYVEKIVCLTSDACHKIEKLYRDHLLSGSFVNHLQYQ